MSDQVVDDRFEHELRRFLEWDSRHLPGAPDAHDMTKRVARATAVVAPQGWLAGIRRTGPVLRLAVVVALALAVVAGVIGAGSIVNQRPIGPRVQPVVNPDVSLQPVTDLRCEGAAILANAVDTSVPGNSQPSWVSEPPSSSDKPTADGEITLLAGGTGGLTRGVYLVDPASGEACLLIELSERAEAYDLPWAPSGDALGMTVKTAGPVLDAKAYVWSRIGLTHPVAGIEGGIRWAADGQTLLYAAETMQVVAADGSPPRPLQCVVEPGAEPYIAIDQVARQCPVFGIGSWSPDRSRLAVGAGPEYRAPYFWVASLEDRVVRRVEPGIGISLLVVGWVDDRTVRVRGWPQVDQIYEVPVDGPTAYRLAVMLPIEGFTLLESPDRTAAVEMGQGGDIAGRLTVVDANGAPMLDLDLDSLGRNVAVTRIVWSPDSRHLAFTTEPIRRTGEAGLWIYDVEETNLRLIARLPNGGLRWSGMSWRPAWR